jgi:hypothetical protein
VDRATVGVSLAIAALGTLFNMSGTIVNVLVALAASGRPVGRAVSPGVMGQPRERLCVRGARAAARLEALG